MMDDDALTDLWRIRDAVGGSAGRLKYPSEILRAEVDRRGAAIAGLDSGNLRMTIPETGDLLEPAAAADTAVSASSATPAVVSARTEVSAP